MTITNNFGLPAAFHRTAIMQEHKSADYSATQLLRSPRHLWLQRRHDDQIEQDVSEMVWALLGTAVHGIIEKGEGESEFAETYLTARVANRTISGTADLYDMRTGKISDWKTTSVYSIIYGSRNVEWEQQLNIYAWLFRQNGLEVNELEIVTILRDWQKSKAKFDATYPQAQVQVVKIPLWADSDAQIFVDIRVRDLEMYRDTEDDRLPYCSDEYRWKDKEKYAAMKQGRKSAVKLHDTSAQAETHVATIPGGYVEHRSSTARRCEDYCMAAAFCNQHRSDI